MRNFIISATLVFLTTNTYCQVKTYKALNIFINQEFFVEFKDMRLKSEDAVRKFKYVQHKYTDEEIEDVMLAYNGSADYFNRILLNVKNDLLDKRKRNFIIEFPEDYGKQVQADIYIAKEFYQNTFQKEIMLVTNGEITGFALLAVLPQVIKYGKVAFAVYNRIKNEMKKFNEDLLNKHLIEPFRFKSWDEIV